jgi:methyl-accepting chemotaxis protein
MVLRKLSAGDLTFRMGEDIPTTYRQIKDDFNAAIAGLQEPINSIAGQSDGLSATCGRQLLLSPLFSLENGLNFHGFRHQSIAYVFQGFCSFVDLLRKIRALLYNPNQVWIG